MFRPRESYDLRLAVLTNIDISPNPKSIRWVHDVFDNSIAVVSFEQETKELRFETTVTLEHFETKLPEFPLEDYAVLLSIQVFEGRLRAVGACLEASLSRPSRFTNGRESFAQRV